MSDALALPPAVGSLLLAERVVPRRKPLDAWARKVASEVEIVLRGWRRGRLARLAARVDRRGEAVARLDAAALGAAVRDVSLALRRSPGFPDPLLVEALALVRELAQRETGQRPYRVQIMGAIAMVRGMIAQMATGEGKTLTAGLAAGVVGLSGVPVHVVTVNDYLAGRDAELMGPLYRALGLSVGTVLGGQKTPQRREAYRCDVTYCTNKELAFDYLRDRIALGQRASPLRLRLEALHGGASRAGELRLRGLHFAIVDEADSVLVDEARTPLLISAEAPTQFSPAAIDLALGTASGLLAGEEFTLLAGERRLVLTPVGCERLAAMLEPEGGPWRSAITREELIRQALSAQYLFRRDEHYIVRDGKVQIVDESTGRTMPDRAWSDGLHQMIERKERCTTSAGRETIARMTYQRFFRRYRGLGGMTGTGRQVAAEFRHVYGLPVAVIPTHRPVRRRVLPDDLAPNADERWRRVVARVRDLNGRGIPVLIGTRSVLSSREASERLAEAGLPHQVLSAAQDKDEARIVSEAGLAGRITVATNMAGRGTDIKLGPGVAELGGLHVIMVERHEARRIDDQLAGRSGRQGEPGCFQAMLSLDDPILDGTSSGDGPGLLRRLARLGGPVLGRALLRTGQRRIERLHARMRAELLRSDDSQDRILAFSGRAE